MKTVHFDFSWGYENYEGTIEVDDNVTDHEIDRMVIDEILSIGVISYNWTVSEDE